MIVYFIESSVNKTFIHNEPINSSHLLCYYSHYSLSSMLTGTVESIAFFDIHSDSSAVQLSGIQCVTLPHPALATTATCLAALSPRSPLGPSVWWRRRNALYASSTRVTGVDLGLLADSECLGKVL